MLYTRNAKKKNLSSLWFEIYIYIYIIIPHNNTTRKNQENDFDEYNIIFE